MNGERYCEAKMSDLQVQQIALMHIVWGENDRKHFGKQELEELAATIRVHGILEPIGVTPVEDRFKGLWGQRRFLAAKMVGLDGAIAHGMLTASLLSTVNGMLLQKPGGISVAQTLHFLRPVFPGDTITACSEVVEILAEKRRLRCRTTCVNQRGELVIDGEAIEQKDTA